MLKERQLEVTLQMAFKPSNHLQPCRLPKLEDGGTLVGVHDNKRSSFKSSYHLELCRLPKLDSGGASVRGRDYKCPSNPPTTYSHAGYPIWTLGEHQLGVTTINGLPSSPPTTCSHADYRSWMLEERQLEVTTTNGLQFLQPLAAVPVIQARR